MPFQILQIITVSTVTVFEKVIKDGDEKAYKGLETF